MPTPDFDDERDNRFEAYLKQFRPVAIDPLPIEKSSRAIRRQFVLMAVATTVAIVAVALVSHFGAGRTDKPEAVASGVGAERLANTRPLTIRSANVLLATAPSFEAAIEGMAFPPQTTPLPKDQHSALAVLSEERIKP